MNLKKELLEKVPTTIKDELHFQALLDHIKTNNIENVEHLKKYLEQEIGIIEKWLDDNKNTGTKMVKTVRDKIVHLKVLKKCFNLSQEFLF